MKTRDNHDKGAGHPLQDPAPFVQSTDALGARNGGRKEALQKPAVIRRGRLTALQVRQHPGPHANDRLETLMQARQTDQTSITIRRKAVSCLRFLAVAIVIAGCTADFVSSGFTLADSAGVMISRSDKAAWASGGSWMLRDHPTVTIGEHADSVAHFANVRRVLSFSDGRIVVATTARPPHITLFSQAGGPLKTIGGEGAGPGEFRAIWEVWLAPPDTIIVFDPVQVRFTFFDTVGNSVAVVDYRVRDVEDSASVQSLPFGRFGDGTYLVRPNRFLAGFAGEGRSIMPAIRRGADGSLEDTLATLQDADYVTASDGQVVMPRFGKRARFVVDRDRILIGMGDDFTVDEYDLSGRLRRSYRRAYTVRPVTARLKSRIEAAELSSALAGQRPWLLRDIERRPAADELPAFGETFLLDGEGNLWVQHYRTAVDSVNEWSVFERGGRWLGTVRMPSEFAAHQIGRDFVLGVWKDSLGVESVRKYGLVK